MLVVGKNGNGSSNLWASLSPTIHSHSHEYMHSSPLHACQPKVSLSVTLIVIVPSFNIPVFFVTFIPLQHIIIDVGCQSLSANVENAKFQTAAATEHEKMHVQFYEII